MRWSWLLIFVGLCAAGFYFWQTSPDAKKWVNEKLGKNQVHTLEIRYAAENIMHEHQNELLKTPGHTFMEPQLSYEPYAWIEAKFVANGETAEGTSLWSLVDAEMVLDTQTWEKTHGYEDCLIAKADLFDFKVLNALAAQGGMGSKDSLLSLSVDKEALEKAIGRCEKKKLLFTRENLLRLHFDHPRFASAPFTRIQEDFVSASPKEATQEGKKYSMNQIKKLTQEAFGEDFCIRRTQEVAIPIYTIAVKNPDGTVLTTQWNALNGQKVKK